MWPGCPHQVVVSPHPNGPLVRIRGHPGETQNEPMTRLALLLLALSLPVRAGEPIAWHTTWGDSAFAEAAREHKFVLLDLHAVWCHWCHVMDTTTYEDPAVRAAIATH